MRNLFSIKIMLFFLLLNAINAYSQSKNATLEFSNIRNKTGFLEISFFKTEQDFKDEIPFSKMKIAKSAAVNGKMTVQVDLPTGKYGISVLDDENNNGKMDYSFLGIPKEGFGFSNYYHAGFTKPKLSPFVVAIGSSGVFLKFVLRYI